MIRRALLVFVSICLTLSTLTLAATTAQAQNPVDAQHVEKVKQEAVNIGDGKRVTIKLRDNKKLVGRTNYVGEEFLSITDEKTDANVKVAYADIALIERKKEKGSFSKGAKIALGVLGAAFVVGMIANGGG